MARTNVPVTSSSRDGTALPPETDGDATNNHSMINDGATTLFVRNSNGSATARTVTIRIAQFVDSQAVASRTKAIAAGATEMFGPYSPVQYGSTLLIDVEHADLKMRATRNG